MVNGYVGVALPYTPIEYIESTGTQWIDTGVVPNQDFGFELDFIPLVTPTGSSAPAYINAGGAGGNVGVNLRVAINAFYATTTPNGELQLGDAKVDNGLTVGARQTISIKNKIATLPSGTTTSLTTADFTSPNTLIICGAHMTTGTAVQRMSTMKLYRLKLYNGSILIKDFAPAKDSNNVACLYENVSGQFYYNSGSGTFGAGAELDSGVARKIKNGYVGKEQSYTPIEYIESSGPQYIDTGYIPKANTKFVLDCYVVLNTTRSFEALFGARTSRYASGAYVFFSRVNSSNVPGYNRTGSEVTGSNMIYNKRITLTTLGTTATWTDGTDTYSLTISGTPTDSSYSLRIFDLNNGGSVDGSYSEMKLYSFKAYENDVLVREFIPVLDQDGVACLYELVEGKFFYDEKAGTFIAGPATGQQVTLQSLAKKIKKGYVGVASSYTQVEYIESHDGACIDTGITTKPTTKMDFDCAFVSGNSNQWIPVYGTRSYSPTNLSTATYFALWVQSSSRYLSPNYAGFDPGTGGNTTITFDQRYLFTQDKGQFYIDGVLKSSLSTTRTLTTGTQPLYLFTNNSGGVWQIRSQDIKLYGCKIYEGDTLVRDFIPVVNQDNVACLFELVEQKFYYSITSGAFTAGATTGTQVSSGYKARLCFAPDRKVSYIEATGTQWIETGVHATQTMKSQMKVMTGQNVDSVIYGFATSTDRDDYRLFSHNGNFYLDMPPSSGRISGSTFSVGTDYNIEVGNFYVKNLDTGSNIISSSTRTFSETSQTMKLFYDGTSTYISARIYYLKIYDGTTLIRDFIPALDGNGVPCLFDLVENQYYYNQGTGTFLYGWR